MRFQIAALFSALTLLATNVVAEEASEAEEKAKAPTIFNDQEVPPFIELTTENIDEELSTGNWLVEFFSPSCPHCIHFAPTLQTAYEYYYTSNPVPNNPQTKADNLNSFSRYYDFKFAKVNCMVWGDACSKKGAGSWPTLMMFKDGEEVKKSKGAISLPKLSTFIEECLETIRPGSRPIEGVKMPEVGAKHSGDDKPDVSAEKDKKPAAGSAAASVHNAVATSEPKKPVAPVEKPKAKETNFNPEGVSVALTEENFQRLVTQSKDAWFVKFYAPWCHHCQSLAPNWAQMAREMKGKLNVGEVNCDADKRLCKDARVSAYPTMLFFRGGERVPYEGLRGVGDLISYANKATEINEGVIEVDAAAFEKMEETEEVIFVYFYDHATTSEDFAALDRLTLSLVGHAKIVKTNDKKLVERFGISTWPRLLVSRDTKPTYFTPLAPKDIRDVKKVLDWMMQNWLPIVPELSATNAVEIMHGKLVVLAVLSRDNAEEFDNARRELKNAAKEWIDKQTHTMQVERQELRDAKQLRIEEAQDRGDHRAVDSAKQIRIDMDAIKRKEVGFAWVDGAFWERWIKTTYGIDYRDGAKVIINDEDNHQYYDVSINGDPIRPSRTSILETLRVLTTTPSKLSAKSTSSMFMRFFYGLRNLFTGHPIIMFVAILVSVVAGSMYSRGIRQPRRVRGVSMGESGFFHGLNEKTGFLSGANASGGGKKD